jgi:hypothetical protein
MAETHRFTHLTGRLGALATLVLAAVLLVGACGDSVEPGQEFTSPWPDDRPLPEATIEAVGSDSGVSLEIELTNFVISSPAAENADGHLHVVVDGGAALMTHETTVELGALAPGSHEIDVGFVANDHRTITADGDDVTSSVVVEIAPDGSVLDVRPAA